MSAEVRTDGRFSHREIQLILIGLLLGMFLAALDQTIISTALKSIAGEFQAFDQVPWVAVSYMLAATATTPLYGKVSDLLGRRKVYLFAIAVFLLGSVLAGAAQSMEQLIVFRGIQGIGAGGLLPLAFAVIGDIVAPRQRSKYQGYFGAVWALASVAGPLLGGLFTDTLSWRWCFYINLPVGAVAMWAVYRYLHLPPTKRTVTIDYVGATLLVAAVSALLLGVSLGENQGWDSGWILGLGLAFVVLTAVFIWWERRVAEPILPLSLFANPTLSNATAIAFLIGFAMFGAIIYLPQYLQIQSGLGATRAGLQMLPLMAGILLFSIGSGRVIARIGRYKPFPIIGTALLVVSMYLLSTVDGGTSLWLLSGYMFALGAGLGLSMQTLILAAQSAVNPRDMGVATSTASFFRTMGGTLGIAGFGVILNSQFLSSVGPAYDAARPEVDAALASPGLAADERGLLEALSPRTLQEVLADTSTLDFLATVSPVLQREVLVSFVEALQTVYLWAVPLMLVGFVLAVVHKEVPLRDESGLSEQARVAAEATV
ncbi:N/A [soil metagenome]